MSICFHKIISKTWYWIKCLICAILGKESMSPCLRGCPNKWYWASSLPLLNHLISTVAKVLQDALFIYQPGFCLPRDLSFTCYLHDAFKVSFIYNTMFLGFLSLRGFKNFPMHYSLKQNFRSNAKDHLFLLYMWWNLPDTNCRSSTTPSNVYGCHNNEHRCILLPVPL